MFMVQVEASRSYVKYATRIEGIRFAPFHIEKVNFNLFLFSIVSYNFDKNNNVSN